MIIDFSNIFVFLLWYVITVILLYCAYKFKKSTFALIPTIYFLMILGVTTSVPNSLQSIVTHRIINFIGLGISLVMYIIIDDIEIRRKVISQVFKNRYKNSKLDDDLDNKVENTDTEAKTKLKDLSANDDFVSPSRENIAISVKKQIDKKINEQIQKLKEARQNKEIIEKASSQNKTENEKISKQKNRK